MIGRFIWDYGTKTQHTADQRETNEILKEIHDEITKDNNRLVYSHKVSLVKLLLERDTPHNIYFVHSFIVD